MSRNGSYKSLDGSTADNTAGTVLSLEYPATKVSMQIVGGTTGTTGSVTLQGSLNGTNWVTAIAASTFANTRVLTSTGNLCFSHLRAFLGSLSSTAGVSVWITGA